MAEIIKYSAWLSGLKHAEEIVRTEGATTGLEYITERHSARYTGFSCGAMDYLLTPAFWHKADAEQKEIALNLALFGFSPVPPSDITLTEKPHDLPEPRR